MVASDKELQAVFNFPSAACLEMLHLTGCERGAYLIPLGGTDHSQFTHQLLRVGATSSTLAPACLFSLLGLKDRCSLLTYALSDHMEASFF